MYYFINTTRKNKTLKHITWGFRVINISVASLNVMPQSMLGLYCVDRQLEDSVRRQWRK